VGTEVTYVPHFSKRKIMRFVIVTSNLHQLAISTLISSPGQFTVEN